MDAEQRASRARAWQAMAMRRGPVAWALLPVAWFYGAAVAFKRAAHRWGWLRTDKLDVPVIVVGNVVENGRAAGAAKVGLNWHTDHYHLEFPALFTFLHAILVPPVAGETRYANGIAAWEALDEETRARITGLKVRQLLTNPDVIEVSYSWLPAFPLNYIVVRFGVSLTSGNVTIQGQSPNTTNFTSSTQVTSAIGTPASGSTNDFGGPSNTLRSV